MTRYPPVVVEVADVVDVVELDAALLPVEVLSSVGPVLEAPVEALVVLSPEDSADVELLVVSASGAGPVDVPDASAESGTP